MKKDFDKWNNLKKKLNDDERKIFCNEREIWWCSIGLNVGSEEDGKNEFFERPILIEKVFNLNMIRAIPLTSQVKNDENHFAIKYLEREGSLILSQMKTISTKRLSRKMGRLDEPQFESLKAKLRGYI